MSKVFIIAEVGVNHNGSIELAKKLIDIAFDAGCDAVKFQTFKGENLVSKNAQKADYQKQTTDVNESQLEMLKKLELSPDEFQELKKYCDKKKIMFLSTAFDIESAEFLNPLIPIFKIPSGEVTNLPLLRKINSFKKPVILSTGMMTLEEIKASLNELKDCKVSLLHCTTEYPCPFEDVNLKAMQTMEKEFGLEVGYSDHTQGIEIPVAAVAMGAKIIEKHFTVDKNLKGPDHLASLEPQELRDMVKSIRNTEKALGSSNKQPSESEIKNIVVARKSIVAKCDIKRGETFTEQNLTTKRPATGISPMMWDKIIGTTANKDYNEDDLILL